MGYKYLHRAMIVLWWKSSCIIEISQYNKLYIRRFKIIFTLAAYFCHILDVQVNIAHMLRIKNETETDFLLRRPWHGCVEDCCGQATRPATCSLHCRVEGWKRLTSWTKFLPISASSNPQKKFTLNPGTREYLSNFYKYLSMAVQCLELVAVAVRTNS